MHVCALMYYICACVFEYGHVYVCVHVYVHMYIGTPVCVCMNTHTHTHATHSYCAECSLLLDWEFQLLSSFLIDTQESHQPLPDSTTSLANECLSLPLSHTAWRISILVLWDLYCVVCLHPPINGGDCAGGACSHS